MKDKTKGLGIKPIADADRFVVPLQQHIGRPAEAVVKAGDQVQKYQLIGRAAEGLSANVHAPVSGRVAEIGTAVLAGGQTVPAVIIDNDHKETECQSITSDDVVGIIKEAGIVGEGGAQFPTDVKYRVGDQKIHTLIINGTECEPYLTADYALMRSRAKEIFRGIEIARKALKADDAVIAIEQHNADINDVFSALLTRFQVGLKILPDAYPQGGELQLIKAVTGMEVPRTTLPKDAGVIVSNVGTIYSIYRAVTDRVPLVSRVITVSGERSKVIGNFEVKIGTPFSHIMNQLGLDAEGAQMVMGGPMMGRPVTDYASPVIKGTSGLLLLNPRERTEGHCISCGYCVEACPMRLMPLQFHKLLRCGRTDLLAGHQLMTCIECGACEYACPAGVPLLRSIKEGKQKIKEAANATK